MNKNEVKDLLSLIDRVYKTNYSLDKDIINDWYKVLKNYDLKDINNSLNYYMENYTEYPPKVYNLTKGYSTIENKGLLSNAKTRCQLCNKEIYMVDYDKHYSRCLDIEYLIKNGKKYLDKNWSKEQFYSLNDIELEDKVIKMQKVVYENTNNSFEKNMLEKFLKRIGVI